MRRYQCSMAERSNCSAGETAPDAVEPESAVGAHRRVPGRPSRFAVHAPDNRLADERDEEIAEALVARAIAAPDSRAMTMLLERRLGKVPDKLELQGNDKPQFEMDADELWAWVNSSGEEPTEN